MERASGIEFSNGPRSGRVCRSLEDDMSTPFAIEHYQYHPDSGIDVDSLREMQQGYDTTTTAIVTRMGEMGIPADRLRIHNFRFGHG